MLYSKEDKVCGFIKNAMWNSSIINVYAPLGFIPIGPIMATMMYIPVILLGILLGVKEGASNGLFF